MRQPDDDAQRALAVIDQTLAGEPVAPEDAGLAELTLILAGQRPEPSAAFAADLDERVARRFAPPPEANAPDGASAAGRARAGGGAHWRRRWLYAPGAALATAAAAVGVVFVTSGPEPQLATSPVSVPAASSPAVSSSSAAAVPRSAATSSAAGPAAPSSAASGQSAVGNPVAPVLPGRQVVRSAQLLLATRPSQLENVAQEVFTVVGDESGFVQSSNVTATGDANGTAVFSLSVPSANLATTMTELSKLPRAVVVSRNDASQDVTGQLGGAGRRLAADRALRTALLRRLAGATTSNQIASLRQQLADVGAAIGRDLAALHGLQHQVDYSHISLTIDSSLTAHGHAGAGGGGFTIGQALHDAGRVLVVAAGVALIALAGLVPVGALAAIGVWIGSAVRRRRREQALDVV